MHMHIIYSALCFWYVTFETSCTRDKVCCIWLIFNSIDKSTDLSIKIIIFAINDICKVCTLHWAKCGEIFRICLDFTKSCS